MSEDKSDENGWTDAALAFASIPATFVVNGWTVAALWRWFVVPFGAHPISVAHAAGLATLVAFVAIDRKDLAAPVDRTWWEIAKRSWRPILTLPPPVLVFGYALHRAMGG